jgi:hypothetical protein
MKNSTISFFKKGSGKTLLAGVGALLFLLILITGCYKFRSIKQPATGFTNSYFDVPIVVERDADPGLDDAMWANELKDIGLFGVMIPDGWTVKDSIPYTIISKNATLNNTGFLVYDAGHSKTLQDSLAAPAGYHWWGAITNRITELTSFDSLYFVPRISTDSIAGKFNLRYAVGDRNFWDRNPADQYKYGGGLSDPMEIDIALNSGVQETLNKANISIFPNPAKGVLNINLAGYRSETIRMNILDLQGRVVMTTEILRKDNTINIGALSKGLYVVELRSGKNMSSHRVVVE